MRRSFALVSLVAMLAACGRPPALSVADGWVRLPAVPGRPAAAYFTLHGGATDTTLVGIASPVAARAELHQTARGADGVTVMTPVGQVAVPAGATIAFAPAGRHVMLFGIGAGVRPGQTVPLTLSFADGRKLATAARAVAAGDPAPR